MLISGSLLTGNTFYQTFSVFSKYGAFVETLSILAPYVFTRTAIVGEGGDEDSQKSYVYSCGEGTSDISIVYFKLKSESYTFSTSSI